MSKIAVVVGASGQQGGAVARALLADGWTVRALGRYPEKLEELKQKGADIVVADINKEEDLERTFKGADAVFHVTNVIEAGPEGELRQGKLAVDVAKKVGVKHFVFSSLSNAERISDGKHKVANFTYKSLVDDYLFSQTNIVRTVVSVGWYYENFKIYLKWAKTTDGYEFFIPGNADEKLPTASAEDIAPVVAKVMANPERYNGRTVVAVAELLSPNEIAATFQRVWGQPVRARALAFDEYRNSDIVAASIFAGMHHYFEEFGYYGEKVNPTINIWEGKTLCPELRSLEQWIKEKMPAPPSL